MPFRVSLIESNAKAIIMLIYKRAALSLEIPKELEQKLARESF
ncbi:hypothetical protein LEP1GSC074_1049 [Leptospira noguchii str. Hook]|nr:hypothetical protein LEP1GSC074_1049 [Leptospira noguchii str. Hook]